MVFLKLVCSCSLTYNSCWGPLIFFLKLFLPFEVVIHLKVAAWGSQGRAPASVESSNAVQAMVVRIMKVVTPSGIQEVEGTLVIPNKASVVNLALLSHLLKKPRFFCFVLFFVL